MGQTDLILISILKASNGEKKPIEFEKVVVKTFEMFPEIFHLKGYKSYPDSAKIEKRIYDRLKPNGYVITAGRKVGLTDYGIEKAQFLIDKLNGQLNTQTTNVLTDRELLHLRRLENLDGFKLFLNESDPNLLDIDIYEFYNFSVRTNPLEIKGKIKIVSDLFKKVKQVSFPNAIKLFEYKTKIDKLMEELKINGNITN